MEQTTRQASIKKNWRFNKYLVNIQYTQFLGMPRNLASPRYVPSTCQIYPRWPNTVLIRCINWYKRWRQTAADKGTSQNLNQCHYSMLSNVGPNVTVDGYKEVVIKLVIDSLVSCHNISTV